MIAISEIAFIGDLRVVIMGRVRYSRRGPWLYRVRYPNGEIHLVNPDVVTSQPTDRTPRLELIVDNS